jgi:hypothetical protein
MNMETLETLFLFVLSHAPSAKPRTLSRNML